MRSSKRWCSWFTNGENRDEGIKSKIFLYFLEDGADVVVWECDLAGLWDRRLPWLSNKSGFNLRNKRSFSS